jgi:cytochrome c oxidase subunit II
VIGTFHLWPPSISEYAAEVDVVLLAFSALVTLLAAPVFFLLVYFAVKYRRGSPADRSGAASRSPEIELSWGLVPLALSLIFFVWAALLYYQQQNPPAGALEVSVLARQWMWKAQHPGGQWEINTLHVPTGQPVRLNMTSLDVIHSLFLPALRIKQDVLPGRTTTLWFRAEQTGEYHLMCTEYCGTGHSVMRGRVVVLEPDAYAAWLERADTDLTLAEQGGVLFRRYGCSGCHEHGDVVRAPSLAGVYGGPVPLASGEVIVADEAYVRDSILLPKRDVVAGFAPIMPSFADRLGEGDLVRLVAYVKSLAIEPDDRE